jgi:microcystin degradation protein MlrC
VDNLVVDSHLHTVVVDDEDTDAASAVVERLCQAVEESALVEDGEALLDVTRLSHGNNATVLTDVKNTVLLEDRAEHVLDNDGGSRVGDEAGLLMELLGEEVNTEVAVLASLRRGGDADDLARAALEDQEIANADVVARDGDGVGGSHLACGRGSGGNVRCRNVRGG